MPSIPTQKQIRKIPGGGLRITALEIRNLWGIAEAVIRPGSRNIIRGANATGKTSILKAIELALGGGTLGKYQRIGSEEPPEIVLEISGPSDSIRIEREGDKPPKVLRRVGKSEAFEKVPAPATFLKGLFDVRGANPFTFLGASDDERAQLLLEALDLEMDEEQLKTTLGDDALLTASIPPNLHPLIRLALIQDIVYSARRGCNVEAESKHKAVEQLKRSVPAERLPYLRDEIASVEAKVLSVSELIAREAEVNNGDLRKTISGFEEANRHAIDKLRITQDTASHKARAEFDFWAAKLRADAEKQIAERELTLVIELEAESKELHASIEGLQNLLKAKVSARTLRREELRSVENEEREKLGADRERLAELRERQTESDRHENTRTQIAEFEKAAAAHRTDSERLTIVMKGLKQLKRQLAEKLPIAGLDISGREIRVNDVSWRDLNKGQKGAIAGIVAVERAKRSKLPIVFFDEAEIFDQEHLDAIADVVSGAGAQLFAAVVVRDGEIEIEADGEKTGSVLIDAPSDPTVKDAARLDGGDDA